MLLLSSLTGNDWVLTAAASTSSEAERTAAEHNKSRLDKALTDLLLAENLIILCGLGSSLCVKDGSGTPLAPR